MGFSDLESAQTAARHPIYPDDSVENRSADSIGEDAWRSVPENPEEKPPDPPRKISPGDSPPIGRHDHQEGTDFTMTIDGLEGYGPATNGPPSLSSGVGVSGFVAQGEWSGYRIEAASSDTGLRVDLTGLSDDVDLYVKKGSQPTLSDCDCRPYKGGTAAETCTMTNGGAATWYIGVYGYHAGSYTIEATLDP